MRRSIACVAAMGLAGAMAGGAAGQVAGGALELGVRSYRVQAQVRGRTAVSTVELTFVNYAREPREAQCLVRLPAAGTVHDLVLWVDGAPTPAELMLSRQARVIYDTIVHGRRDPAILESAGPGLWRLSVFPVPAGGTAKVKFACTHLLELKGKQIEYAAPVLEAPDAGKTAQEVELSALVYTGRDGGGDVRAGKRALGVSETSEGTVVGFRAEMVPLAEPIGFLFSAPAGTQPVTAAARGADGVGLVVADVAMEGLLKAPAPRGRDVVLLYDASESMTPAKKAAAHRAAAKILRSLKPGERFGVVVVRSDATFWRETLSPAGKADVEAAVAYLAGLEPSGGTDLTAGLKAADSLNTDRRRRFDLFVVSDGWDNVGAQAAVEVRPGAGKPVPAPANLRVFGAFVENADKGLFDLVARTGGQGVELACDDRDDSNVEDLVAAAENLDPASVKVAARTGEGKVRDVTCRVTADGRRLLVTGRGHAAQEIALTITGRAGGETVSRDLTLTVGPEDEGPGLQRIHSYLEAEAAIETYQANPPGPEELAKALAGSFAGGYCTGRTSLLVLEKDEDYRSRGIARAVSRVAAGQAVSEARDKTPDEGYREEPERLRQLARADELHKQKRYDQEVSRLEEVVAAYPADCQTMGRLELLRAFLEDRREAGLDGEADRKAQAQAWARTSWFDAFRRGDLADLVPVPFTAAPAQVQPRDYYSPERVLGAADGAAWKKLEAKVARAEFRRAALKDVAQWMQDTLNVPVRVSAALLASPTGQEETRVSCQVGPGTGLGVLKALATAGGQGQEIGFWLEKGTVVLSVAAEARLHMAQRTYDVRDLLASPAQWRAEDRRALSGYGGGGGAGGGSLFGSGDESGGSGFGGGSGSAGGSERETRTQILDDIRRTIGRIADAGGQPSSGDAAAPAEPDDARTVRRTFDIRDVLVTVPNFVGPRTDLARLGALPSGNMEPEPVGPSEKLLRTIRTMVDPGGWDNQGLGRLEILHGKLIVTQTQPNQVAVARLLAEVRGKALPPGTPPPAGLQDSWPEALFTFDGRLCPWVLDLLARAADAKLSKFSSVELRHAGGRSFARIGGIWFDTALRAATKVHLIAPVSSAAAALAAQCPRAKPCFAVGAYAIVAAPGGQVALCLDDEGLVDADDPHVRALLQAFTKGWDHAPATK